MLKRSGNVCLLAMSLVAGPLLAYADIVTYQDEHGRTHYVDSLDRVPHRFRDRVNQSPELPSISKMPSVLYKLPKGQDLRLSDSSASNSSPQVELFVTSWCAYCRALEKTLRARNIAFRRYDIERDKKANAVYQSLGVQGVPVTRIGTTIISGFQPERIIELVKK